MTPNGEDTMHPETNDLGQPVGRELPRWSPPPAPPREPLAGRTCRLEPVDPARHADALFAANRLETDGRSWTYMGYGPFENEESYRAWLESYCTSSDPLFYAIVDGRTEAAGGVASYCRIQPAIGTIEMGHIHYSPRLRRTVAATEALAILVRRAFELGYRRCEWKCDALNAASRSAAQRLGFSFEGVHRQGRVYKGRNRDTAWYALIDAEWPAVHAAHERWLAPENFDERGEQRLRLSELTRPLLAQRG